MKCNIIYSITLFYRIYVKNKKSIMQVLNMNNHMKIINHAEKIIIQIT